MGTLHKTKGDQISNGVKIAVIDYGMGNLGSVVKACNSFGADTRIIANAQDFDTADKIILPGVGAFGDAATELKKRSLDKLIKDKIKQGLLFLGICLGMHLLLDSSQEAPGEAGLGLIPGQVVKFKDEGIKVPHIGWNQIEKNGDNPLLKAIEDKSYVYFCHSYYVCPDDKGIIITTTDYGAKFASIISKDNIFGIQFHPEKSQKTGLKILENFIKL